MTLFDTMRNRFLPLFALVLVCAAAVLAVRAADSDESELAFNAAAKAFNDGLFERAEREFGEFGKKYTNSARVSEALLLQAQSRFQLRQFDGVISLLAPRAAQSGPLEDKFVYWLAESELARGQFKSAAEQYARLSVAFTNSPLRLEAAYGEAFAWFRHGDVARTLNLLTNSAGAFRQASAAVTNESLAVQAGLLLSEAHASQKDYRAAEAALNELEPRKLAPDLEWKRQFGLAQIELAEQKTEAALARGSRLAQLAAEAKSPQLLSQSHFFAAEILKTSNPDLAIQTLGLVIQDKDISAARKREALLRIVDLLSAQNRIPEAVQRLEAFLAQNPQEPSSDLFRLTVGELHLKQFYAALKQPGTNSPAALAAMHLQPARTNLSLVINNFTNSPHLGRAFLTRGWCLWEESSLLDGAKLIPEALAAFQSAAERLRDPVDQSMARFKAADCYFLQRNFTNALQGYHAILQDYQEAPAVKERLFPETLHQIVRSSVELKDWTVATEAVSWLVAEFPRHPLSDRSAHRLAQALLAAGEPARARATVDEFRKKFPDSALVPEAELLAAKTHADEGNWALAAEKYSAWTATFTNHPSLAQAEFDRAWIHYRSNVPALETNAFLIYSNFVQRFSSSPLAPLARDWIADYFFNHGEYRDAELNYQLLFTNVHNVEMAYMARVMAATSALRRDKPSDARQYLTNLVQDPKCPPSVLPEAWFVLGDVELADATGKANALTNFGNALNAFRRLSRDFPGHPLDPLARGKSGHCSLQLNDLAQAEEDYQGVINSPAAGVSARSEARVGLGLVNEKKAAKVASEREQNRLLRAALDHYLAVIYPGPEQLKPGEQPDPFWIKQAGLAAGQLAEKLDPAQAAKIYERLLKDSPALRPLWEKKLAALGPLATPAK